MARRENRELREASDLEELVVRDLVGRDVSDLVFSLNIEACSLLSWVVLIRDAVELRLLDHWTKEIEFVTTD